MGAGGWDKMPGFSGYQLCPENRRCFGQGQFQHPVYPMLQVLGVLQQWSKLEKCHELNRKWRSFWTILYYILFLFVWEWHLRPKPRIAFPLYIFLKIHLTSSNIIWPIWQPSPQFWLVFWRHPLLLFTWPWSLNNLVLGELMWNSILFRVCLKIGYPKLHLYHDVLHSNCHWAWLEHKSRKPEEFHRNSMGIPMSCPGPGRLRVAHHRSQRLQLSSALQTVGSWWGRRSAGLNSISSISGIASLLDFSLVEVIWLWVKTYYHMTGITFH